MVNTTCSGYTYEKISRTRLDILALGVTRLALQSGHPLNPLCACHAIPVPRYSASEAIPHVVYNV